MIHSSLKDHAIYRSISSSTYFNYLSSIVESKLDKKLNELWNDPKTKTLETKNKKYAIISDLHIGNGSSIDRFKKNEQVTLRALNYYFNNNYSLILLGDIEELWRFRLNEILQKYNNTIYRQIRKFGEARVHRIFGNHDIDWQNTDPVRNSGEEDHLAREAIKLKDIHGNIKILLIHGHQGTNDADTFSWLSKPVVKWYRYLEPLFYLQEGAAAPSSKISSSFEKNRYKWARDNSSLLICGHTHRAVFCSKSKIDNLKNEISVLKNRLQNTSSIFKKFKFIRQISDKKLDKHMETLKGRRFDSLGDNPLPCYFNTGCALYHDGITLIEIVHDNIKLVKWNRHIKERAFDVYENDSISECLNKLEMNSLESSTSQVQAKMY